MNPWNDGHLPVVPGPRLATFNLEFTKLMLRNDGRARVRFSEASGPAVHMIFAGQMDTRQSLSAPPGKPYFPSKPCWTGRQSALFNHLDYTVELSPGVTSLLLDTWTMCPQDLRIHNVLHPDTRWT